MQIKKVKVANSQKLEVTYFDEDIEFNAIIKRQVTEGINNYMTLLIPHALLLSEMIPSDKPKAVLKIADGADRINRTKIDFREYEVYSISESSKKESAIISFKKRLSNNKVITINTPLQDYEDEKYDFSVEFSEDVQGLFEEVEKFINQGTDQLSLLEDQVATG